MSYFSPIGNGTAGDPAWGVIGIQIKQKHYGQILPTSVLEEPYQISFIAAFEANTDKLIWHQMDPRVMHGETWDQIKTEIIDKRNK